MAYNTLKAAIQAAIKNNDNEEITGDILQGVLLSIVNSVGSGYNFAGVATPSTNPGTPDGSMFWIGGNGTYTSFGNTITVPAGFLGLFMWDGSSFSRQIIKLSGGDGIFDITAYTGNNYASLSAALADVPEEVKADGMTIRYVQSTDYKYMQYRLMVTWFSSNEADWQGVDNEPTEGSNNLVTSGGIYASYTKRSKDTLRYALSEGMNPIASYTTNPALETIYPNCYILSDGRIRESNEWCVVAIKLFSGKTYKIKWNGASVLDVIFSYAASTFVRSINLEDATLLMTNVNGDAPTEYTPAQDLIVFVNNYGYNQSNRLFTSIEGYCWTYDFIKNDVYGNIQFYNNYFVAGNRISYLPGAKFSEYIEPLTDLIITNFFTSSGAAIISYYDKNFQFVGEVKADSTYYLLQKNTLNTVGAKYVVICLQRDYANCKIYGYIQKPNVENPVYQGSFQPIDKVAGYTRRANHSLWQQSGWYSNIYNVEGVPFIQVTQDMGTDWALFTILFVYQYDTSDPDSINNNIVGYADSTQDAISFVKVPPCAKYAVVTILDTRYNISPAISMPVTIDKFYGKTCIYMGDSISTRNNYQWMGFLEYEYGIKYVRQTSAIALHPAEGGISLIPNNPEPESDTLKSIWYRCANHRMSGYKFDIISIFGGTNDMDNPNVGTYEDTAYVDTLDGFDSAALARVTNVRPDNLTYAASLKGCIEMMHRDNPSIPIIIPTVMPMAELGQELDGTDLTRSERYAIVAMRIVAYYESLGFDITAVPLYWGKKTSKNCAAFATAVDGVHPNTAGAKDMVRIFAEALLLNRK